MTHIKTSVAVVVGASGGVGSALVAALRAQGRHDAVTPLARAGEPPVDVTDEGAVAAAAAGI
ncbi:MAG TPA: short-chain dehydrogenase, partial [Beijerinckiaceae bacterium]